MTPVTKKLWQMSERAVSRGQAGVNRLRDGILSFANIDNVTIAKPRGCVPDLSRREICNRPYPGLEILCESLPNEHSSRPGFLIPWAACPRKTCRFWCSQRRPYTYRLARKAECSCTTTRPKVNAPLPCPREGVQL
jgi:hypothetical protein